MGYNPKCEYFPKEQACENLTQPVGVIANVVVKGLPVVPAMEMPTEKSKLPALAPGHEDIDPAEVVKTRHTRFSIGRPNGVLQFMVNGKPFSNDTIHEKPLLGTTEKWNVGATSAGGHPYHIHINPFQVDSFAGRKLDFPMWKDVVLVSATMTNWDDNPASPDSTIAIIYNRYLQFAGPYVMHCHILDHEDQGMMQKVEVFKTCEESDLKPEECPPQIVP
jgi:FtsP/CotA-like multicopper oxidase with cupredoxin domain